MFEGLEDQAYHARRPGVFGQRGVFGPGFSEAFKHTQLYHSTYGKDFFKLRKIQDTGFDFPGASPNLPYDTEAEYAKWQRSNPAAPSLEELDAAYLNAAKRAEDELNDVTNMPDFDGEFYLGEEPPDYRDPSQTPATVAGMITAAVLDPVNVATVPFAAAAPALALRTLAGAARVTKSLSLANRVQATVNSRAGRLAFRVATGIVAEGTAGGVAEKVISHMTEDQRRDILGLSGELTPDQIDQVIEDENRMNVIMGIVGGAVFGGALAAIPGVTISKAQYDDILDSVAPAGTQYRRYAEDIRNGAMREQPSIPESSRPMKIQDLDIETASREDILRSIGVPQSQAEVSAYGSIDLLQTIRRKLSERYDGPDPELERAFDDLARRAASTALRGGKGRTMSDEDVASAVRAAMGAGDGPDSASQRLVEGALKRMYPDEDVSIAAIMRPLETPEDVFVGARARGEADIHKFLRGQEAESTLAARERLNSLVTGSPPRYGVADTTLRNQEGKPPDPVAAERQADEATEGLPERTPAEIRQLLVRQHDALQEAKRYADELEACVGGA